MPVVGFIGTLSVSDRPRIVSEFHKGLKNRGPQCRDRIPLRGGAVPAAAPLSPTSLSFTVRLTVIAAIVGTPASVSRESGH